MEFRIFESLEELGGAVTLEELAKQESYDIRILEKLLNCLVCIGLLEKFRLERDQNGQYVYSNTKATKKCLLGSSPGAMSPMVPFFDYLSRKVVRDLPEYMENGIPSAFYSDECVKRRKKSLAILQESLPKEHVSAETFGLVMEAFTNTCVDAIVNAFDLSCHKAAVDLGGGFGLLAETVARKHPEMKVSVFEQEHVTKMAQNLKQDMKIAMLSGDLFNDELPEADLYILCHVIENWTDDKSRIILRKVFEKLPQGGKLLLVEKFLCEDKTGPENPVVGSLFSAIMGLEGDYKTELEYRDMLEKMGFTSIESKCIEGYNDHDVMIATKPE